MILHQALPQGKRFLRLATISARYASFVLRFLAAFLLHYGRMSASQAAQAIRTQPCHRASVLRFLRRLPAAVAHDWLEAVGGNLLAGESPQGCWLFILDQTYCGHQGGKAENTFSTAHNGRRQKHAPKSNRKKKSQHQRSCHGFIMGLLITPTGLRLPCFRSYYTDKHCRRYGLTFRKQTQHAADLIDHLRVPPGARVVVLGDTAFDAEPIQAACGRRGFTWIVAMNGERVIPGPSKPRPKVTSLVASMKAAQFVPIRLTPGQGPFVAQRRIASCRIGPKAKTRTFYVHQERLSVVSVGAVQVAFSTKKPQTEGQTVAVQKVLMTNDLTMPAATLVELYDLRWQIELFFKELKSTLGLHQYRLREFACVERWVELCLLSFVYLEWYRRQRLRECGEASPEGKRWRWQRSHGLCQAVRQDVEVQDIRAIGQAAATPTGLRRLKRHLRQAIPKEYRKAF